MSDLPANAYWLAWLAAALCVGWGLLGLVGKRMRFMLPLPVSNRFTARERHGYSRVVTGNLARGFGVAFIGVGALALASFKAGAVVAAVLGVAGWVMGSWVED